MTQTQNKTKLTAHESKKTVPVICIDGFSGSGKGTIAQRLAKQLGWHYLDSGMIYRALALALQQQHIDKNDLPRMIQVATTLPLRFETQQDTTKVFLHDQEVSTQIRSESIGKLASEIAAIGPVRQALLQRQHAFRTTPGLVADGRDMGTVVFPDADLKFFFTASLEERAARRYKQLQAFNIRASLDHVISEIKQRDTRDQQRKVSPLVPAPDAILIDTTNQSIEEVFATVLAKVSARLQV